MMVWVLANQPSSRRFSYFFFNAASLPVSDDAFQTYQTKDLENLWGICERIKRCSDGQVIRASASGAVDLGLISSRVKPMTITLVFTAFLLDAQH